MTKLDKNNVKIVSFRTIDNRKNMYAVLGTNNLNKALQYVREYKKMSKKDFYDKFSICMGSIHNDNLYMGDINARDKENCLVVYRRNFNYF